MPPKANKINPKSQIQHQISEQERSEKRQTYESLKSLSKEAMTKHAEKYLSMVADPRGNEPVRSITTRGGYPGRTGLYVQKTEITVFVGSNGYGYCHVDPQFMGPTGGPGSLGGFYSTATASALPSATFASYAPAGVSPGQGGIFWGSSAPFTKGNPTEALTGRCIAAAMYILPDSSVTTQSGHINLFENPGHMQYGHTISGDTIAAHKATRKIRATQLGDTSVLNVLNWHPQASAVGGDGSAVTQALMNDDALFRSYPSIVGNLTLTTTPLFATFYGSPGNSYNVEIWAVYEARGSLVSNLEASWSNPMAEAIIWNAFAHKTISGWNSTAKEAVASYQAAAIHVAKSLSPDFGKKVQKAVGLGTEIYNLAKNVGGFFGFI